MSTRPRAAWSEVLRAGFTPGAEIHESVIAAVKGTNETVYRRISPTVRETKNAGSIAIRGLPGITTATISGA